MKPTYSLKKIGSKIRTLKTKYEVKQSAKAREKLKKLRKKRIKEEAKAYKNKLIMEEKRRLKEAKKFNKENTKLNKFLRGTSKAVNKGLKTARKARKQRIVSGVSRKKMVSFKR